MASSRPDNGLIRDTASAADGITKIYACATLWHESPLEMMCMLKSVRTHCNSITVNVCFRFSEWMKISVLAEMLKNT
jgi:hypothetical protein